MENPYKDNLSRFAVTYLRSIIAWNDAEYCARRILEQFGGGSLGLMIAVEHLQGRSLKDALNTLCDMFSTQQPFAELTGHIAHFVKGFDVLRGYRNFYVHSIRGVGQSATDATKFEARLLGTEARGKLAWINQAVTTEELEDFMRQTMRLRDYGNAIKPHIPGSSGAKGALNALLAVVSPSPPPLSALEKPKWPESVTKDRRYLQER